MKSLNKAYLIQTENFIMPMTHTETIGFCSQVAQLIEENAETEGIDATNWISGLRAKRDTAITTNAEQDELQLKVKAKTRSPSRHRRRLQNSFITSRHRDRRIRQNHARRQTSG
jgi:hypothetical protein